MKDIITRVGEWTGKVMIPVAEAMQQKVTIYAPKRMTRKEALALIYNALKTKGYIIEDANNVLYVKPIATAKLGVVPTIPDDQPLASIENKDQVVQRFFKMKNYSAADMGSLIQPLVGDYAHVSSDMTTGTLLVIDTVANLIRVERMIQEFDVPEAGQTVSEVVQLEKGDPVEIVQLIRLLMGDASATSTGGARQFGGGGGGQFGGRGGQFGGRRRWSRRSRGPAWSPVHYGLVRDDRGQSHTDRHDPRAHTALDHRPGLGPGPQDRQGVDHQAGPGGSDQVGV